MTMFDPLSDSLWKADGKCYELQNNVNDYVLWESFFADSVHDRKLALEFCEGCDVQKRCLKFALESGQIWGVWGGRDESEIRRALWTNANGSIGSRAKYPRCPWCLADNSLEITNELTHQVRCESCDFSWKSETTILGMEENPVSQL